MNILFIYLFIWKYHIGSNSEHILVTMFAIVLRMLPIKNKNILKIHYSEMNSDYNFY